MLFSQLKFVGVVIFSTLIFSNTAAGNNIKNILELVKNNNQSLQSIKQELQSIQHKEQGSGYFPDPNVKINVFGSPIETRNGPQRSNIMLNQMIPWPKTLRAEEQLAASMANLKKEQLEILLLDIKFQTKSLIFKYIELSKKLDNKNKMISTMRNLNKVLLSRLRLGSARQAEVARINIEIAKLDQSIQTILAKKAVIHQKLLVLTGGKKVEHLIPTHFYSAWGKVNDFDPNKIAIKSHPFIRLISAKISFAQAGIEKEEAKGLPKLGASVSWFQIEEPETKMAGSDAGKDAWAVGASISIPIWRQKYNSFERSAQSKKSSAQFELNQKILDLKAGLKSVFAEFEATQKVSSMFKNDILPQANLALKTDQSSYTQGNVPFERVIENYIRVIKFEDKLIESRTKLATLKAALEKLVGKDI